MIIEKYLSAKKTINNRLVKGAVKDGLGKSLSAREEAGWDENSIQGGERSCKRFGEIKYFAGGGNGIAQRASIVIPSMRCLSQLRSYPHQGIARSANAQSRALGDLRVI
jgi:hypothetical protein